MHWVKRFATWANDWNPCFFDPFPALDLIFRVTDNP